jgi:release factor glutamine methyltransferase
LAAHCPDARVYALDISPGALSLARHNAQRHAPASSIQFLEGNSLQALPQGLRLDLLVSNPPYIPTAEIATLQPEVRDYDPRAALDGGTDGLDFYRYLAVEAPAFLRPEARLMLELGDSQSVATRALFETQNWVVEGLENDYHQRPRILIVHRGLDDRSAREKPNEI